MASSMQRLMRHTDLVAAGAVVLVVVMMIIPLPPALVDLAITLNISVALAIVTATLYLPKALDFAAFPSLLLLTTLFRLAINISVTRLILLHADGGHVVQAFGNFVVGGNVAVGLVIFLILVIIQFGVLITVINLIGGLVVGVVQQGMPFSEAIQHFSLLTVGDGLTAQIPALLISVATGILVTRATSSKDLGNDIADQIMSQKKAPLVAGAGVCAVPPVPGLPKLPFLVIGGGFVAIGWALKNGVIGPSPEPEAALAAAAAAPAAGEL